MGPDEDRIAERIRANPPSCIAGFRLSSGELPERSDRIFQTVYRLACRCGKHQGMVLGHRLKDYNLKYDGPEFITPLSFQCVACATITPILDTDVHGYHAEVGKLEGGIGSAKYRGKGTPSPIVCPTCSGTVFSVTVGFLFWHFDLVLDEPELPGQEFFNEFLIYGACQKCGKESSLANLGKL